MFTLHFRETVFQTAIQMYTVRERSTPLVGLLREAASAGFDGVEFATRFHEAQPRQVRATLEGTGLAAFAAHVDFGELVADDDDLFARYREAGCRRLIIPHLGIDHFRTGPRLDELIADLSALEDRLAGEEMTLAIHTTRELLLPFLGTPAVGSLLRVDNLPVGVYNHAAWLASLAISRTPADFWHRTPLGHIAEGTDRLKFELDAKSVATAGFGFNELLVALADRTCAVHVSDVCRSRRLPPQYRPVFPGDGLVDPHAIVTAAQAHGIDWLVAEHDNPPDPEGALRALSAQFARPGEDSAEAC